MYYLHTGDKTKYLFYIVSVNNLHDVTSEEMTCKVSVSTFEFQNISQQNRT